MNKSTRNPNLNHTGKSPDPYLRAFLRYAVAIIAVERGLNEISTAKLRSIANQFDLSESTFNLALEQLKTPESELGLNRYEKEFLEYLNAHMASAPGRVLGIRTEQKLIDLARNKYQLDVVRAHQLIQKCADASDVATISHADAKQHAENLIEDAIGISQTNIAFSERERLRNACSNWGLDASQTDLLIEFQFEKYRQTRRKRMTNLVLIAVAVGGLLLSSFYSWAHYHWGSQRHVDSLQNMTPKSIGADSHAAPNWWPTTLRRLAIAIQKSQPQHSIQIAAIKSRNGKDRKGAYQNLINSYLEQKTNIESVNELIGQLYFTEPDEDAATAILDSLRQNLLIDSSINSTNLDIRCSHCAVRLLSEILYQEDLLDSNDSMVRVTAVRNTSQRLFGINANDVDPLQYVNQADGLLALEFWNNAVRHSIHHPAAVVDTMEELEKLNSEPHAAAIAELRNIVVQNVLNSAPQLWPKIKPSIAKAIETARSRPWWQAALAKLPDDQLLSFLSNAPRRSNHSIRKQRENHAPKSEEIQKALATKQSLELQILKFSEMLQPAGVDRMTLEKLNRLETTEAVRLLPQLIQANNLRLAWIELASGRVKAEHLQYVSNPPKWNNNNGKLTGTVNSATPSAVRKLAQAFRKLADSNRNQTNARISAIEEIAALAEYFNNISYSDATTLLSGISDPVYERERLAIERAMPSFLGWPNLYLAFADSIASSPNESYSDSLSLIAPKIDQESKGLSLEKVQMSLIAKSHEILDEQLSHQRRLWQAYHEALNSQLSFRYQYIAPKSPDSKNWTRSFARWLRRELTDVAWENELRIILGSRDGVERSIGLSDLWCRSYCVRYAIKLPLRPPLKSDANNLHHWTAVEFALYRALTARQDQLSRSSSTANVQP